MPLAVAVFEGLIVPLGVCVSGRNEFVAVGLEVATTVQVAVGVSGRDGVVVAVGKPAAVGVTLLVGLWVRVGVRVGATEDVPLGEGRGVEVGVPEDEVEVPEDVGSGVGEKVGVREAVAVGVNVGLAVWLGAGDGVTVVERVGVRVDVPATVAVGVREGVLVGSGVSATRIAAPTKSAALQRPSPFASGSVHGAASSKSNPTQPHPSPGARTLPQSYPSTPRAIRIAAATTAGIARRRAPRPDKFTVRSRPQHAAPAWVHARQSAQSAPGFPIRLVAAP